MLVCGVDDAGRGSLLGPLVIAGVSATPSVVKELYNMGVKDSKLLSPKNREILYKEIIKQVDSYYIAKIAPVTIDRNVINHRLNYLEAQYMAKVISKLSPDVSLVDSCDVNSDRYGQTVTKYIKNSNGKTQCPVFAFHKADRRFAIVAAASILAKVSRDRSISRLRKTYHDLGSGYPSDKKTVKFVRSLSGTNGGFPAFVRKSWKTAYAIQYAK